MSLVESGLRTRGRPESAKDETQTIENSSHDEKMPRRPLHLLLTWPGREATFRRPFSRASGRWLFWFMWLGVVGVVIMLFDLVTRTTRTAAVIGLVCAFDIALTLAGMQASDTRASFERAQECRLRASTGGE
jgi:hypothetical protein